MNSFVDENISVNEHTPAWSGTKKPVQRDYTCTDIHIEFHSMKLEVPMMFIVKNN